MKNNLSKLLLIIVCIIILGLIIFIVVDKQNTNNSKFNIKKGDILEFDDNISIKILKVSSSKRTNEYNLSGEIEVSLKVDNDGETSNYTLKSFNHNKERIINSNYYVILTYENDTIKIDVKDKSEI